MKHVYFTFLCVLLALFESYDVFAQLMTYSGEFARGKATYTYLTDGEERIYNGGFNYISTDGKHKIKGQFKDDLKEGEWVTEWNGFEERANYLSGKKHGDYSVFYKDDNYYLNIKAQIDGEDFMLIQFEMRMALGQIISAPDDPNHGRWVLKFGRYHYYHYFHDKVFTGEAIWDDSTGKYIWGDTNDDFEFKSHLCDSLFPGRSLNFPYKDGEQWLKLEVADNNQYIAGIERYIDPVEGIFKTTPRLYPQILSFFLNDFHEYSFKPLEGFGTIGEQTQYIIVCIDVVEDLEETARQQKIEEDRIEQIRLEELRKKELEEARKDSIALFMLTFNGSEYGKMIKELGQMDGNNLNDRKQIYRTTLLQNCSFTTALQKCENPIMEFNYEINGYQNCNLTIETPLNEKLSDTYVLAVPTKIAMSSSDAYIVEEATILYFKGCITDHNQWLVNTQLSGMDMDKYFNDTPQYCYINPSGVFYDDYPIINEITINGRKYDVIDLLSNTKLRNKGVYCQKWKFAVTKDLIEEVTQEDIMLSDEQRFDKFKKSGVL